MNDSQQRVEALNIEQSFIVQAPAGSGKTELLTQRYLKLLSYCQHPEEVIAITFTKKAVDELKKRIFDALEIVVEPKETHKKITFNLAQKVRNRSEELNWQLLKNPTRLKILTLDSLAGKIAKQQEKPTTTFEPVTDWKIKEIYHEAISEVLNLIDEPEYQENIINVLRHLGNDTNKFIDLMMAMLQKRDQWLRQLLNENKLNKTVLNKVLDDIIHNYLSELEHTIADVFDDDFYLDIGLESAQKNLDFYLKLKEKCLTKSGAWRKNLLKKYPKLEEETVILKGLNGLMSLPNNNYSDYEWEILKNITQVLKLTLAQLNIVFNKHQVCDYIAINLEANNALGAMDEPSNIALFLDNKINHILLDEFQDTSITQINLLKKLLEGWQINDGKTLFLVGDPMQSIYRFREAEVGLFGQVSQNGIANIKPILLKLSTNFRSTKAIVTANNKFFQQIFPEIQNSELGQISYSPSTVNNKTENLEAVEFYAFGQNETLNQAQKVIEVIKKIPKNEDIAILVRARSHLNEIMDCLTLEKMPFEAIKFQELNDYWLIRDLLALTCAITDPNDKLSWLSLLRSPWCGLNLDDLLLVTKDLKEETFFYELETKKPLLSQAGQERLDFFLKAITPVFNKRGSFLLSDLVISCCERLLMNDFLTELEQKIKYLFFKTLMTLENNLDFSITQLQNALANLYTPSKQARIKLMTIHNAKGLEFDNVILANLNKGSGFDKSEILLTLEDTAQNFIVAPSRGSYKKEENQIYNYIKSVNTHKNQFELMRLLYVAMTRAKKKIVLLSTANFNKKEQCFKAKKNTFLHFLMPFFSDKFAQLNPEMDEIKSKTTELKQNKIKQKSLINAPNISNELMLFEANEASKQRNIGVLIHRYFEFEQNPSEEKIQFDLLNMGHINAEHINVEHTSMRHNNQYIQRDAKNIKQILEKTKNDKVGQWIFKQRDSTQTEVPFSFVENKITKTIIIDRLFIDAGVLWIIDFKTTQKEMTSLETFKKTMLEKHQKQLNNYEQVLKNLYKNAIKKALYFPSISLLLEVS